jgi:hypothetical protein
MVIASGVTRPNTSSLRSLSCLASRSSATTSMPERKHFNSRRRDPIIQVIADACEVNAPDPLEADIQGARAHVGL